MNGPAVYSNSVDRLRWLSEGMEEAGLTLDPSMVLLGNYSRKSGYKQAEAVSWLIRQGRTDAVIAANDRMAIGLLQGLKELGLQVGKDVALIGCDDSDAGKVDGSAAIIDSSAFL